MFEVAADQPDFDEYEAEQERAARHRKKVAARYEYEEMIREEKETDNAGD